MSSSEDVLRGMRALVREARAAPAPCSPAVAGRLQARRREWRLALDAWYHSDAATAPGVRRAVAAQFRLLNEEFLAVLEDKVPPRAGAGAGAGLGVDTNDAMLGAARATAQDATRGLQAAARDLEEAHDMAVAAREDLEAQRQSLVRAGVALDATASDAARARQLAGRVVARLATDKFLQVFACLVVACVVAIAVLAARGHRRH